MNEHDATVRNVFGQAVLSCFAWLDRHKTLILSAGLLLQLGVLIAMAVRPAITIAQGQTILLDTVPVDPRSMFRGDYVILRYEFNDLPHGSLDGVSGEELEGRIVYLKLKPANDEQHWKADGFTLQKPSDGTFLRGRIQDHREVDFGLDAFFVQEDTGTRYEEAAREGKLSVEVTVDDSGNAVLRRLILQGDSGD